MGCIDTGIKNFGCTKTKINYSKQGEQHTKFNITSKGFPR